jgi:arylsulfatase A-like enzyme
MNIVFLVIDTLRYDYIGANGNDWIETPNLDALAHESWVFDRAYAASFPTLPHRRDVLTGRYGGPFHGWGPLPYGQPTMPRALAEAGYATQLIHDTPHLINNGNGYDVPFQAWTFIRGGEVDRPWIDDSADPYLPNWGRDKVFDFLGDPTLAEDPNHYIRTYVRANRGRRRHEQWNAARLFRTAADFLRDNARREKLLLWVDSFDPHEPWDAPPEYVLMYDDTPGYDGRIDPRGLVGQGRANLTPEAARRIAAWYAAKVTWVDRWLGEVLLALDETGLSEETALILTSDHGTNIGPAEGFGKRFPVGESVAHVPLMIRAPGRGVGRCDAWAQPQDITATMLALAGLEPPADLPGEDLLKVAAAGEGRRELALTGRPLQSTFEVEPEARTLFTVFADDWCLQWAADPADCHLVSLGDGKDVAAEHPRLVEDLWRRGLDELLARGVPEPVADWLGARGRGDFPADACEPITPPGYNGGYWAFSMRQW